MFTGSATSSQAPIAVVQYKVEGGQFANAVNVSGNWSQFSIRLPLPPTAGGPDHVLTIRAIDTFGTTGEISKSFAVHPQPPIVVPPGSDTTFSGAPTTSSITSWTRLEPQSYQRGHRHQLQRSRVRPAVDADPPVADGGVPGRGRRHSDSGPRPRHDRNTVPAILGRAAETFRLAGAGSNCRAGLQSGADAARGARRAPADARERRDGCPHADVRGRSRDSTSCGCSNLQALSKSYRPVFITKLALQPLATISSTLIDDASARYLQSMVGRAPDGRQLATLLRTSGAGAAGPRSRPEHRRRRSSRRCSRPLRAGSRGTTRCTASRAGPRTMPGIRRGWSTRCRSGRGCRRTPATR